MNRLHPVLAVLVLSFLVPRAGSAQELEAQPQSEERIELDVRDPLKVFRKRIEGYDKGVGGRKWIRAVDLGLEWLRNNQAKDGSWKAGAHGGDKKYDNGVTGLALLAFLGAGLGPDSGTHGETVERGLAYLLAAQSPLGCFDSVRQRDHTYEHAICTAAVIEAYALSGRLDLRRSAENGLTYLRQMRDPDGGGWRYVRQPKGNSDSSVTGWMLMALRSAIWAGLDVDDRAIQGGLGFLDTMIDPKTFKGGYTQRGSGSARKVQQLEAFPPKRTEALTAVILAAKLAFAARKSSPEVQGMVDRLVALPPTWDERSVDMYYWYYGSVAMFLQGGRAWKSWQRALDKSLVDHQQKRGEQKGAWDPAGPWGPDGGRVYSTAIAVLSLESPYRLPH